MNKDTPVTITIRAEGKKMPSDRNENHGSAQPKCEPSNGQPILGSSFHAEASPSSIFGNILLHRGTEIANSVQAHANEIEPDAILDTVGNTIAIGRIVKI